MIGAIAAAGHRLRHRWVPRLPWRLLWTPVCGSTEPWLESVLASGGEPPLALIAGQQRHGHGQRGRPWSAPPGGVWISSCLPWPPATEGTAALGLCVALGLCLELEELGLQPQIKWPNDLIVRGQKLAGLLPRLRLRGSRIMGAQVGLGLNGRNRVPAGAISLHQLLGPGCPPYPALVARVLRSLEWATAAAQQPEAVRRAAEERLAWPDQPLPHDGELWDVSGLGADGALLLQRGQQQRRLHRRF